MKQPAAVPDNVEAHPGRRIQLSRPVIALASAAIIVLQIALGAALWLGIQRQGAATDTVHLYEDAKSTALQVLRGASEIVVTDGSSSARQMLVGALKKLESMDSSVGFKRALESTKTNWPDLSKRLSQFSARENVGTSDIDSLIELGKLSSEAGALVDWLDRETDGVVVWARQARNISYGILAASIFSILIGTMGYLWTFHRRVTRPLNRAVLVAERLSAGDLTPLSAGELDKSGEAAALMAALSRVTENLNQLVAGVRIEVEHVRVDSQQMAQANFSLSKRTEQQAATLEQTAAAMEQMTATVSKNAENANEATDLATRAASIASRGGESVQAVVSTMSEIADASKKISEIIGVIDSIAFQTNILALNAAVEAARAGEQGRGFAVVAAEVRSLAKRSATAAKEIKDLITDSVAKVEIGSQQVGVAGSTTEEIMAAANAVRMLIEAIATASQEQLQGIKQATDAIVQMETVTQQNAAMVEQSNAMAQSQADRTEALARMVAVFKTSERAQAEAAPAATAAYPARAAAHANNKLPLNHRVTKPTEAHRRRAQQLTHLKQSGKPAEQSPEWTA